MGQLIIIQKDDADSYQKPALTLERDLPTNYMNDYSVLGLLVSDLSGTLQILAENQLSVIEDPPLKKVSFKNPSQLKIIAQELKKGGIVFEMADLAQAIYQG
jgi:hypothetical protein